MPTVLRAGPYRLYFYSNEGDEPPHVHVDRDGASAKIWLKPVRLAANRGFGAPELTRVLRLVAENQDVCWNKWREHFH